MLGIAFSATIGGIGSLIGTPPNALLAGFVERTYGVSIGFAEWMMFGVPIVVILLPITWLLLTRLFFPLSRVSPSAVRVHVMEPLSRGQSIVAAILVLTALAWVFRPLFSQWIGISGLTDAGIAMLAALALFTLPDKISDGQALLTWDDIQTIRWDVLILFGGGLALAGAVNSTGLAEWVGTGTAKLRGLPIMLLVLVMMVVIVYLGELASNTAMAAIFLPIAGAASLGLGVSPLTLVLPVALAASLGFMLPVATPPNAIVYGSGAVSSHDMLRAGAALDVISIVIVFVAAILLGPIVFDLEAGVTH
jgi:sodium-dependent dicarboxylate transporter 2/3/5